jgi:hypothetical protein
LQQSGTLLIGDPPERFLSQVANLCIFVGGQRNQYVESGVRGIQTGAACDE